MKIINKIVRKRNTLESMWDKERQQDRHTHERVIGERITRERMTWERMPKSENKS